MINLSFSVKITITLAHPGLYRVCRWKALNIRAIPKYAGQYQMSLRRPWYKIIVQFYFWDKCIGRLLIIKINIFYNTPLLRVGTSFPILSKKSKFTDVSSEYCVLFSFCYALVTLLWNRVGRTTLMTGLRLTNCPQTWEKWSQLSRYEHIYTLIIL